MPDQVAQRVMPSIDRLRLVETEVKVGASAPKGTVAIGLDLGFGLFEAGEVEILRIVSHYTVSRDEGGETHSLYSSDLTHHFWWDSNFTSADALRWALRSVWPYVRRDMENIAKAHDIPLRGVPLMLPDDAFPDDAFADFKPENSRGELDS